MRLRLLLLFGAIFLSAIPAIADTTYTYTGNPFTTVSGPFTSGNSITGSITVSSPIAPDTGNFGSGFMGPSTLAVTIPDIVSFSFSDGVDTLDGTNVAFPILNFATDDSGNIIAWEVDVMSSSGAEIFFSDQNPAGFGFSGNDGVFDAGSTDYAGNSQPGVWTLADSGSAATPEPASLALLGTGIAFVATQARRRRPS